MKQLFITMCLAVLTLAAKADDVKLVVNFANGSSQQEFALSDIGKLAFDESGFSVVEANGTVSPFTYVQVSSIKFANFSSGIGAIEATTGGMKPYYRNNQLGVDGWQAGNTAKATIYNVGVMMVTSIDNWDGTPISTSNLANGVYIFKVNNNTIKFVKQ